MQFLTSKQVCERTSLSRSSLDRLVAGGAFPQPMRITERRMAFLASDVEEWMASFVDQKFEYLKNKPRTHYQKMDGRIG